MQIIIHKEGDDDAGVLFKKVTSASTDSSSVMWKPGFLIEADKEEGDKRETQVQIIL